MLASKLREVLYEERKHGRKPTVVVISQKDFDELIEDLPIKGDAFDELKLHGVNVVTPAQVLELGEIAERPRVKGFSL